MDQNRDWKPAVALILAGLALFIALGGTRSYRDDQASAVPQQIIVQPAAPSTGSTGTTTAPVITVPAAPTGVTHAWGGWHGGSPIFALFPLLFLAGLLFLLFRVIGPRRHGWGGPGWYGYGKPWEAVHAGRLDPHLPQLAHHTICILPYLQQ